MESLDTCKQKGSSVATQCILCSLKWLRPCRSPAPSGLGQSELLFGRGLIGFNMSALKGKIVSSLKNVGLAFSIRLFS